jgi:hypothetical protein
VLPLASIADQFLGSAGGIAAAMAVGIFIGQARPSLDGEGDAAVRRGAAEGGIAALCIVLLVLVLSSAVG